MDKLEIKRCRFPRHCYVCKTHLQKFEPDLLRKNSVKSDSQKPQNFIILIANASYDVCYKITVISNNFHPLEKTQRLSTLHGPNIN